MFQNKLIGWLAMHQIRIEGVLVAVVIVGGILRHTGVEDPTLITFSMVTLGIFYFISAYFPSSAKNVLAIMSLKVAHIASSTCVVGLLFAVLHLTGAEKMLMVGVLSITIAGVILIFYAITNEWRASYIPLFTRILFLGGFSALAYMQLMQHVE